MGTEVAWGAGEVGRAEKLLWGGDRRGNPGPQREKRERRLVLPAREDSEERTGTL